VDLNRVPPILLQTFFVVAEVGQISEAARRLHLSQPAVTGHIRRLEANLETTLFIRSARGVTLTPLGARLRERLHHVFVELEQVTAPFDGIVTARNVDIGAYVPAGSGTQLFRLARISPLRVYVDTPEAQINADLLDFIKS
jgi:DNA-binding transcriptional LysR family regulator